MTTPTRRNVWELGGSWAPDLLWYARGVQVLEQRPLAAPTSWRFYAGMHGFHRGLWSQLGYLSPSDQAPSASDVKRFWAQCQHGSWFFLPWHRGYLLAFESNVRAAIADLGGPSDEWALPYWNYFGVDQADLPPEFAAPDWPDGGDNPLFVGPRYGPNGDGTVFIPVDELDLDALTDPVFTGVTSGGSPGFGGVDTGFSHGGRVHGRLETQPHDYVHGLIGGAKGNDPDRPGAMSVPASAGLDPIFWLHHANIDRLWEVWIRSTAAHTDPTDAAWRNGPASLGQREFCMPMPDGSTWTYTPADVLSLEVLGYTYDDLPPVAEPVATIDTEGLPDEVAEGVEPVVPEPSADGNVELVGTSDSNVALRATPTRAFVEMDPGTLAAPEALEAPGAEGSVAPTPDRVFLNLENVRGTSDATTFAVYVGLPSGAEPSEHPELLAGSLGLFGLSEASDPEGGDAGEGITYVLEISEVVRREELGATFDVDRLPVTLVPVRQGDRDPDVTIGRISIFRQGA